MPSFNTSTFKRPNSGGGDILGSFAGGLANGPIDAIKSLLNLPEGIGKLIEKMDYLEADKTLAELQSMSPHQRQELADSLTETAGGFIGSAVGGASGAAGGAMAFGLGAIPGAAAGATAGAGAGGAAGRTLSRIIGRVVNPKAFEGVTAADEAYGLGKSITGNATLEGGGRALGIAGRTAKAKALAPTLEAAETAAKAKAAGVPQSLGVATGRKWAQKTEAALGKHPFSSGIIMDAKRAAQAKFEEALQSYMGELHPSEVGPEAYQDLITKAMEEARGSFQSELQAKTGNAVDRFGSRRTSVQAGEDLQAAHLNAEKMFDAWRNKAYPEVYNQANSAGVSVDPTRLGERADQLLGEVPADVRNMVLSSGSRKSLRDAGNVRPKIAVDADVPGGIDIQPTDAEPLLLKEAGELRSALYKRASQAADANERRIISELADSVDQAIEASVKGSDPEVYSAWRNVNAKFKAGAEAIRKPSNANPNGNPMAGRIKKSTEPERLVGQATDNPSRIEQSELATNPETINRALDPELNTVSARPAMDSVRRNQLDRVVDQNAFKNGGRISPEGIANVFADPKRAEQLRSLFGGRIDDFVDEMGSAAPRERELYDSPLGKVLDREAPSSQQVLDASFPRKNAGAADASLDLLPEGPSRPGEVFGRGAGRRAFAEDLAAKSTKPGVNRSTGERGWVDPSDLSKKLRDSGETAETVLGADGAGKVRDLIDVGQSNYTPDALFGNSSGTGPMHEMFRIGRDILTLPANPARGALAIGKTLGSAGVVQGAAKLMTNPKVVDWAVKPVSQVAKPVSKGGAMFRGMAAVGKPSPTEAEPVQEEEKTGGEEFGFELEQPAAEAKRQAPPKEEDFGFELEEPARRR